MWNEEGRRSREGGERESLLLTSPLGARTLASAAITRTAGKVVSRSHLGRRAMHILVHVSLKPRYIHMIPCRVSSRILQYHLAMFMFIPSLSPSQPSPISPPLSAFSSFSPPSGLRTPPSSMLPLPMLSCTFPSRTFLPLISS
jgi:hypothetical protein